MAPLLDMWPKSPSVTLLILIGLTIFVYRTWKSVSAKRRDEQFARDNGCLPPPLWIACWPLGLDFLAKAFWAGYNQRVCEWFNEMTELCATTHEQRLLGARNIGTIDPQNLEAVLKTQAKDFNLGFRSPQFRDLLGESFLTQEGEAWKHSRDLLRPLFGANRLYGFEDIRRCVESMLDEIESDTVIDMYPRIFQLTLDTTLFMLYGENAGNMQSSADIERRAEFGHALNVAQEFLAYRTRVGPFHWLINGPSMWRACRVVHGFVDAAIGEALQNADKKDEKDSESRRYVFIDALIKQTRDPKVLRDQCLSLTGAGRDSTAACLTWTIRLLAHHPEVLSKVRDEVASVVGLGQNARQPSREDLRQMAYLNLAIKESLRIYPPVPVNQRAATRTTTLPMGGGPDGRAPVLVREGESVGYLIYGLHRRKDIYGEDAKEFRPERWQNDALKDVGYGFLPFGAGPRACLGQEFAMTETAYTIARMIQRFPSWTVPEGETTGIGKEKQLLTLVVSCADGVRVRLSETIPA